MRSLETINRLHKWKVDEKSRAVAKLQEDAAKLALAMRELARQLEEERRIASQSIEAASLFVTYMNNIAKHRERLEQDMVKVEELIVKARDELREAMGEAKKFEIAEANRKARERLAEKAREDQQLDEIALQGFVRKEDGV